jgi:hypothetical protein
MVCQFAQGTCGGTGTCVDAPEVCATVDQPVCGCDGETHSNGCTALAEGVSVAHDGACADNSCWNASWCGDGEYCSLPTGQCYSSAAQAAGSCETLPEACDDVYLPVCGCDNVTYGNACSASAAGVSVQYEGACQLPCFSSAACGADQYCAMPIGVCGAIAFEDGGGGAQEGAAPPSGDLALPAPEGTCTARAEACDTVYEPVCGCDFVTYGNSCEASAAGMSIAYQGASHDGAPRELAASRRFSRMGCLWPCHLRNK